MRSDAREFMQVYGQGAIDGTVQVIYRSSSRTFLARCQIRREGLVNRKWVESVAEGRADALSALAIVVAECLHPIEL